MTGLVDVVRRLGDDPGFRDALARDPKSALAAYALTVDELTEVARLVEPDTARLDLAEQRRSRAGFFSLLSAAPTRR